MWGSRHRKLIKGATGFLARLRRDSRGNTLMMMAAMMIPLAGLSGSAIDMGRLYAVKSRLQQACDAGVLAGRKMMVDTSNTTLDAPGTAAALAFFANNFAATYTTTNGTVTFHTNWFMINNGLTFTPSKPDPVQVSGTATAIVPMTIMTMFGFTTKTVTVTCTARYDVADADIMFVLDTTGSMACLTSDSQSTCDSYASNTANITGSPGSYAVTEKSNSRISGVRSAVLNFFDTVTGQAQPTTNFRFGFVPYNATVNVGKLLQPMGYIAGSWKYQTRVRNNPPTDGNYATATSSSVTEAASSCATGTSRSPATGYTTSGANPGTATVTTVSYASGKCTTTNQLVGPNWVYGQNTVDVSQYIQGGAVTNPAQVDGSTATWAGCIEERATVQNAATFTGSNLTNSLDLDVDTAPSPSLAGSYWGPMWPEIEFARTSTATETLSTPRTITWRAGTEGAARLLNELPCPLGASRLTSMTLPASSDSGTKSTLRNTIQTYLSSANGFKPYGVTYHDVGMTWGTRLLSPNGIFASDTAAWPGHNPPNRFIIFLTDGTMETDQYAYASHGIEYFDQRVTTNMSNLTTYHNTRFATACTIAKNHNITVFVIAFAQTLTSQLTACASPGKAYYASDTTGLNAAFTAIAQQVAMLRISQ